MFCSSCGQRSNDRANFCPHCGAKFALPESGYDTALLAERSSPAWSSSPHKVTVGFGLALIVVVGAILGALGARRLQKTPANHNAKDTKAASESKPTKPTNVAALLKSAKSSNVPGVVYRFACQVPGDDKDFKKALREIARADRLLDQIVMRPLRREAANNLQNHYYEQGHKIQCKIVEGKQPTLVLTYVLFDETTAYVMKDDAALGESLLHLGIQRIRYESGFGGGSWTTWNKEDVDRLEFGHIHDLCDEVRDGLKEPDAINSSVRN